jgi:CheY-like chemotaxis protein
LIRQVRSLEGANRFPAVALTAYAQAHDRERALAAGFQLHVAKPVRVTEFVNAVAELVRRCNPPT